MKHISVLKEESINALNIKEDGIYVDCTLGYAGHASAILKRLKKGKLYAFDQDIDAIKASGNILSEIGSNFEIIQSNFVNLKDELLKRNVSKIDGILFDLGVSSVQIDDPSRGFSFHSNGTLDMRMNKNGKLTAKDVVNTYPYERLYDIIKKYGEEKYANLIAKNIVACRQKKEIVTTMELSEIINNSVPFKYRRLKNPSRRTFQAIRIEVNNELEILPKAFNDAIDMLTIGGVIAVITFHSLEDKICKEVFLNRSKESDIAKKMPIVPDELKPELKVYKKIKPSKNEIENNIRAHSATLRYAVKERMK